MDLTLDVFSKNSEDYMMFSLKMPSINEVTKSWRIVFLDSFQFLPSSLELLTKNLLKSGKEKLKLMNDAFSQTEIDFVLRKGSYPYEHMDAWEKFDEQSLPIKEAFYSQLTDCNITDDDYEHANAVWKTFEMKSMADYHDLYLKTDVLLLGDIFENFRELCLLYYRLDPLHYITLPSMAWDACLRMSPVQLELIVDPDMYQFMETGIRGGISMITHRYAEANNRYTPNFDSSKPSTFILSLDANNLYGYSMVQQMPTSSFKWLTGDELIGLNVMSLSKDSDVGYIFEVDLNYPMRLHDAHNDYPLAPEILQDTT